jgi:bile acid-coenzyme A ligase
VDTANARILPAEILAWLNGRLDPQKWPGRVHCVSRPVRDDAGKVRRHRLARAASSREQARKL